MTTAIAGSRARAKDNMRRDTRTDTLWLQNTSRYPNAEVFPLLKVAYESSIKNMTPGELREVPRIIVKFTNSQHRRCGRVLTSEWHVRVGTSTNQYWRKILCRIGKPSHWPIANETYYKFKDMMEYPVNNYREGIVHIIAHEMEHVFGAGGRKRGEERCELAAQDAVDLYRKNRQKVDDEIKARIAHEEGRRLRAEAKEARRRKGPATEERAETVMKAIATWTRKRKLAETKIRKYNQELKRLSRKMEAELEELYANKS